MEVPADIAGDLARPSPLETKPIFRPEDGSDSAEDEREEEEPYDAANADATPPATARRGGF